MQRELLGVILRAIFSISLILSGIGLIWFYSCWQVAVGVFLIVWGNNFPTKSAK